MEKKQAENLKKAEAILQQFQVTYDALLRSSKKSQREGVRALGRTVLTLVDVYTEIISDTADAYCNVLKIADRDRSEER
ncbi:MAG TPA: hypothetical protein GXZ59_03450 [Clostridiaceae bacterium]|nr:hypothetical protein [Clostridiaceae bacterium]